MTFCYCLSPQRCSIFVQGTKIYGKSSLKMVPLIGWAWMFTESIFLKREWQEDKRIIMHDLQHLMEYPDNYWVTVGASCSQTSTGSRWVPLVHRHLLGHGGCLLFTYIYWVMVGASCSQTSTGSQWVPLVHRHLLGHSGCLLFTDIYWVTVGASFLQTSSGSQWVPLVHRHLLGHSGCLLFSDI